MNELLLEFFSEEIPAKMQNKAASDFLAAIEAKLKEAGITYSHANSYATPRRITLHFEGLPNKTEDKFIEKKGPKIDARAEAIQGFLKASNLKLEDLKIVDGFYYASIHEQAKEVSLTLKDIIEQVMISFTWPKSMRLSGTRTRWVRPLRNILCIFAKNIIPVKFGNLVASNYTFGHRFMAPSKFEVNSFKEYQEKLAASFVILSAKEREEAILNQVASLNLPSAIKKDSDLLQEIVGLVEYPNSLVGSIEARFLKLPKEVLICSMKTHQRYFHCEDQKGNLMPFFITVANIKNEHDKLIISGNEKVLKARLSDAEFFWNTDLKTPLSESLAKLAKLIFHHKLGNMFDKTNRIIALAEFININAQNIENLKKAALMCKTDLVSEMVGEFPELQGVMGKYYALEAGMEMEVAEAIAEHYRPYDNQDIGNTSILGAIIAIADKIDTIVGLWFAGEKPTSSKDPFALRRAALGIIKLIRYHKLDLSIEALVNKAIKGYNFEENNEAKAEIIEFFKDRLKYYFKNENYRHDFINAVLSYHSDNIALVSQNIEELSQFIENKDLFFMLKRITNIVGEIKTIAENNIQPSLFEDIEHQLYEKIINSSAKLESLQKLIPITNLFFEQIMVNVENQEIKNNRLNLLSLILNLSNKIANFNLVEV